jgi:chromosomal replication initiator protein
MYRDGITLPKDVVEYVAYHIKNNIRELEGAMISIVANASLNQKAIDLDLARSVLKNLIKEIDQEVTINSIQRIVCEYYSITTDMIKSTSRKRKVVQARQITMYFGKKLTKLSLKNIGEFMGGRDHSTVIHSCQIVDN